jgi:hypothetical protein
VVADLPPYDDPWPIGWDFDIDIQPPMTLRVHWNDARDQVKKIERILPPVWQDKFEREGRD